MTNVCVDPIRPVLATTTRRRCVTRVEIADHVETVFFGPPVHRDELCKQAADSSARPAALAVLQTLPADHSYRRLADLWPDLPALPIEDDTA